jgi:hypothetical protein
MIKVSIDPKVMQNAMSGVADQIKSQIDLTLVKNLCKKRYKIETINGVEPKDAKMVVIENQVACKLDFEVSFSTSIFITTKEKSNTTLSENRNILEELDDIPDELNVPPELEDIIQEDLDDLLEDEPDDKDRLK